PPGPPGGPAGTRWPRPRPMQPLDGPRRSPVFLRAGLEQGLVMDVEAPVGHRRVPGHGGVVPPQLVVVGALLVELPAYRRGDQVGGRWGPPHPAVMPPTMRTPAMMATTQVRSGMLG